MTESNLRRNKVFHLRLISPSLTEVRKSEEELRTETEGRNKKRSHGGVLFTKLLMAYSAL